MGEALLRAQAGDRLSEVYSAGIGALVGHGADPTAVELMAEQGIDLQAHRAQQASAGVLSRADLVLAMDRTHLDWLHRSHPQLRGRSFLWLHWRDGAEVPDPFREPRAAFEEALELITEGTQDWLARIG